VRVLIDYRPALRQRSGAGEYTHQLVKALLATFPKAELELTVFSSSWKDRLDVEQTELAGVTAIDSRVPVRLLNLAWHRLGWPSAEGLTGCRFAVTHSSHPLILPSRAAAHVVTIHDLNFLSHPERTQAEIRRDYPPLVRDHARRADRILVPSQFTAGEVTRQLGVAAEKISVCPPGAPPWTPRAAPPTDGYVLFLGTLEPRKNVGALLDAYERLSLRRYPLPRLVLAGKATDESRVWLERIARPPLDGAVRHIGYVEPANRRELYEGARLLVQPSFEEGFGLPVLEAMTVGVPVVAANRGALPEVIRDAGLLVDPDKADEMAAGIDRMLTDQAYAATCAAKGVERARQFQWGATARRVYEAYQLAVEHRQCASA
jgi:glycosyltransferase involved in cell wall biosynthesis